MNIRYVSNVAIMIAGGFLVVATQAFVPATVAWLTFAVAAGATVVSAYMVARGRALTQRAISLVATLVGAWTIVASLVFLPATVLWLGFAGALAFVATGLAGLTAHELTTERVVHSLQVDEPVRHPERDGAPVMA